MKVTLFPQQQVPTQVGREDVCADLGKLLRDRKRCLLSGPGMGISVLVSKAAADQGLNSIVTLDASSEFALQLSLLELAREQELPERFLIRPADLQVGVRAWLREHNSVVVLDRLSDIKLVTSLLDGVNAPVVGVTEATVSQEGWTSIAQLQPLSQEETLQWLMHASGDSSHTLIEKEKLEVLARAVGGHPMATRLALLLSTSISVEELVAQCKNEGPLDAMVRLAARQLSALREDATELLGLARRTRGFMKPLITSDQARALRDCGLLQICPLIGEERIPSSVVKALPVVQTDASLPELPHPQRTTLGYGLLAASLADEFVELEEVNAERIRFANSVTEIMLKVHAWKQAADLNKNLANKLQQQRNSRELGLVLRSEGRAYQAGEKHNLAQQQFLKSLKCLNEYPEQRAAALMDLVEVFLLELQTGQAQSLLKTAASLHAELSYQGLHEERARRLFLRGACLLSQGEVKESLRILRRAYAIIRGIKPEDDLLALRIRFLIARALFMNKEYRLAEELLKRDLECRRSSERVTQPQLASSLMCMADVLLQQGKLAEAEKVIEELLDIRRRTLLRDNLYLAQTCSQLAKLKSSRGAFADADSLFREAITIITDHFGPRHPEVASVSNDLAENLFTQGKYDQARRILDRSLRIQESTLRKSDPALSRTRNNLAAIHTALGRFNEAERLYRTELELRRQKPGDNLQPLATTLNNLGEVLRSNGQIDESLPYFKEALELRQQVLPEAHPHVAQSLTNLAYVHLLQHRLEQAKDLFEQSLHIRRQVLSKAHPHIASTLSCLTQIAWYQDNYAEARGYIDEAVEVLSQVYGTDHPQHSSALIKSARVMIADGHKAQAELLLLKSKQSLEKSVGSNHRFYGELLHVLGELRQNEGKLIEAFPMLERALAIHRETTQGIRFDLAHVLFLIGTNLIMRGEKSAAYDRIKESHGLFRSLLGISHPRTIKAGIELGKLEVHQHNYNEAASLLGMALESEVASRLNEDEMIAVIAAFADAKAGLQQFDDAEQLLKQQLALLKTPADEKHLSIYSHLAGVKYLSGEIESAEPWVVKCIELAKSLHGEDHPETAKHSENLAGMYFAQGRREEAEKLMKSTMDTFESHYGWEHPSVQKAAKNYSRLLHEMNRHEEAQQLEQRITGLEDRSSHVLDDLV